MRTTFNQIATVVGAAGLLGVAALAAQPQPPHRSAPSHSAFSTPAATAGELAGNKELQEAVRLLDGGIRKLRGQITSAGRKDANLRILAQAEEACLTAKSVQPRDAGGKPRTDSDAVQFTEAVRTDTISILRKLLDAEQHVALDQLDDAKSDLEEAVTLREASRTELGVSKI